MPVPRIPLDPPLDTSPSEVEKTFISIGIFEYIPIQCGQGQKLPVLKKMYFQLIN